MTITDELTEADAPAGRRGGRVAWLVAGAALTIIAVGATAFAIGYQMTAKAVTHSTYQTHTYAGQPRAVVVQLASGDVVLRRGSAGQITVRRHLQWSSRPPVVDERWDGHTLRLKQTCPAGVFGESCQVDDIVTVPASVSVTASTAGGNITVNGVGGPLELSSASGDVAASGPAGPVSARTASGNITVTGARSADVSAKTDSGDVELAFAGVPAVVNGETASGNVTVFVPPGPSYNVQADTVSGNRSVTVGQDPASQKVVIAHSASGDVTVANG